MEHAAHQGNPLRIALTSQPAGRRTAAVRSWMPVLALLLGLQTAPPALAEGSRTLYPASYPTSAGTCANVANRGCRANLDLQPGNRYVGKIQRRTFLYVYAEAGEYVLLASRNRTTGGDILVYNPQDFGTPGDETLPATADFSCAASPPPAGSFSGGARGQISTRAQELAGPHSADGMATVTGGYLPCAYRAPVTGIYGVQFTPASSGATNLNADIFNPLSSSNTVAAWDVTVRASAGSLADLNGRLFTYAWVGFAGVNNRPIYTRHDYVTLDGYRYAQQLAGLDPNGFAFYGNRLGFLDNGQPLYKSIRGNDSFVFNLAPGLATQRAEFPIFFSSVAPAAPHAAQVDKVLTALGIPLSPQAPVLQSVSFTGRGAPAGNAHTRPGAGGTFHLTLASASTFQIVVSRDGVDFSPANSANAVITGIAGTGAQDVPWDGNDASGAPLPPSAQPYAFRATARAGEIHLPMIDAENNGNGTSPTTATFGGGPTVTKLNGPQAGDATVFFDDRGYLTRGGALVGQMNGSLCPSTPPSGPAPLHAMGGVDSTLTYGAAARLYRWWTPGVNANSDCAPTGGWGDAKGLDLWTYVSTAPAANTLWIDPLARDAAAQVQAPTSARPGTLVQGRLGFANHGDSDLSGLQYGLAVNQPCGATPLAFGNLPAGASATCADVAGQGVYTFTGLPSALAAHTALAGAAPATPITFSYTAPPSGTVTVQAQVSSGAPDDVPGNDTASATTTITAVDLQAMVSAPLTALAGETVQALAQFSNLSGAPASPWTASITVGTPGACPSGVQLAGAPPGVAMAGFDAATCALLLSGLPSTLADGQILSIGVRYQEPAFGQVTVTSTVATADDAYNAKNSASTTTRVAVVNMAISLAGLPPVAVALQPYFGTFSCTNTGLLDATAGTRCAIDSGLPPGLAVTGCVLAATGLPWAAGNAVPAGATVTCTVQGTPQSVQDLVLAASTAATGDALPGDNNATLALAVVAPRAIPTLAPAALLALAAGLALVGARRMRRPHGTRRR